MRIALVTQWFPPERGTLVAASIADGLASRGHDVDVVTGFPNYPSGVLYPEYPMRIYRRDRRSDRVTIHRGALYPSHDANAVRRMINYLSFAASSSWTSRRRLARPDVWLTYSSPATAAVAAGTAPGRLRAPTAMIIQDLWPDSVIESGFVGGRVGRGIEKALTTFCDWTYRRSDAIGVISPGMRTILTGRGVDSQQIHDTPNWIDDRHLEPDLDGSDELRHSLGLPGGLVFMYAGNLGELQGLGPLVDAFARCPWAELVFVGDGVLKPRLQRIVAERCLTNVTFVPPKDTNLIGRYIAASDVQVVSLKDSPLLRATMPSKVQASLAAGRPILAHATGDVADVIVQSGAGLAASPGRVDETVAVLEQFRAMSSRELRDRGCRARRHFELNYSEAAGAARLENMLSAAIETRRRREMTTQPRTGVAP